MQKSNNKESEPLLPTSSQSPRIPRTPTTPSSSTFLPVPTPASSSSSASALDPPAAGQPQLSPASRSKLQARRYLPAGATEASTNTTLNAISEKARGKRRATSTSHVMQEDVEAQRSLLSQSSRDDREAGEEDDRVEGGFDEEGSSPSTREKGKEKEKDGVRPPPRGRHVSILFSNESGGNLELWVEPGDSVGSVKEQIRHLRPALLPLNLRLIYSGRLLTDGILLVPWLRSLEDRLKRQASTMGGDVESVLKEVGLAEDVPAQSDGEGGAGTGGSGRGKKEVEERVWLHCIVGGRADEKKPEDVGEEEPTAPRRRGFDVLLDAGLSPSDVASMRRQFYESRGEEVPDGLDVGDVNDEHARALEEQWIEGDLTADTATTSTEGMYTSILHGLLTGFLFPLIPLFFFRELPLPNFFDAEAEARIQAASQNQAQDQTQGQTQSWNRDRRPSGLDFAQRGITANRPADGGSGAGGVRPGPVGAIGQPPQLAAMGAEAEMSLGVVFGKRMQMGILLGTVLNFAFAALRFLN